MNESRCYGNYSATFVYGLVASNDRADVIDLWMRNKAFPPDGSVEQRLSRVVLVVREVSSSRVVAVNTVERSRLRHDGPEYYLYRIFIDPAHRIHDLHGFMTKFAYEAFNKRYSKGDPVGLAFVTENRKLQRPGIMTLLKRSGWEYLGRVAEDLDLWRKLFILPPSHQVGTPARPLTAEIQVQMQQAFAYHKYGQLPEARKIFDKIFHSYPLSCDTLHMLGVKSYQGEQYADAADLIGKAIALNSGKAAFYSDRGLALQQLKQFDAALEHYDKAIAIQPSLAITHLNRGNVLKELRQPEAAVESYETAALLLEKETNSSEALHQLGLMAFERKEYERTVELIDKAIALNSDSAAFYSDRGLALQRLKRLEKALESYDKAIAIRSDIAIIHLNRGNVLKELRHLDAAVESYDQAIFVKPDYATAHWNKSLEQLILGDFDKGWKSYEWRWKEDSFPSPRRNFPHPLWLGKESLQGRTILLHSEQGLGDTIQFCRYIPLVADVGGRVVVEVEQPLIALLQQLAGVSEFVVKGSPLPAFELQAPLLSMPLAFKTKLDTIPCTQKYLVADSRKVAEWQQKLGPKSMPRIGLVWSGRPEHQNDHIRSMKLSELVQYLPTGLDYVALQKEIRPSDWETLESHNNIAWYGKELKDFADTAALCELMDLVISVDTSVAHLSGALSRLTWVLLPFIPDWRWLLKREDSPWYKSVKLYRQTTEDDWSNVLHRVKHDLCQIIKN